MFATLVVLHLHLLAAGLPAPEATLTSSPPDSPCERPCGASTSGTCAGAARTISCAALAVLGCDCSGCCAAGDTQGTLHMADADSSTSSNATELTGVDVDSVASAAATAVNASRLPMCSESDDSHPLTRFVFDEACLALMSPSAVTPCPRESVRAFMDAFAGENDVLLSVVNIVVLYAVFGFSQLGGIPEPKSVLHTLAYVIWLLLTALQALCALCSVLTVVLVYAALDRTFHVCMTPWHEAWPAGPKLLSVVGVATFGIQPVFTSKVVLLALFLVILETGAAAHGATSSSALVRGLATALRATASVCSDALAAVMALCIGWTLLLWFLSATFAISVVYVPLVLPAVGVSACLFVLVRMMLKGARAHVARRRSDAPASKVDALAETAVATFAWLDPNRLRVNRFVQLFSIAVAALALAPLVVFGSWTAAYLYGRHPGRAESNEHVRFVYAFAGRGLRMLRLPALSFPLDLDAAQVAFAQMWEAFLSLVYRWAEFDVQKILGGASGLASISLLTGFLKPAINSLIFVFATLSDHAGLGFTRLADASEIDPTAEVIDLSSTSQGDEGAASIGRKLGAGWLPHIHSLLLDANGIGDGGVIALAEGLKGNASLTNINLLHNQFSAKAAARLLQAAKSKGDQLKSLCGIELGATSENFGSKSLGDSGAILLSYDVEVNASLTMLELWSNQIGDKGAIGLAEGLKVNASLTQLGLSYNKIADEGAIGLGKALEVNASLTRLDLDSNKIINAGAVALGKALAVNASLTKLELYGNQIADAGAIGLAEGLKVNASLTELRLSHNLIEDAGAIGLGKALAANASLKKLELNNNQIADAGAIGLGKGLKVNASLKTLVLYSNQITDAGGIGLGKALKVNASLKALVLYSNQFGEASKSAIKTAWLSKPGRGQSDLHF